jgi:hypothetical protein
VRFSLRSRRALVAAALAAPLLFLPAAGSAQEPGPYDGLPLITTGNDPATRNTYGWLGVAQVGRAYSPVSQQWGRVPVGLLATNIEFATTERTDENGDLIVDGDFDIHAYLQPTGGGGDQYGLSPEIVIRTVAFGSIPTEVRLQLRQRRDEADLPVGFYIRTRLTTNFTRQLQIYPPTGLEDLVDVAVVGLTVDDVPVPVEDSCATGPTARIELASEAVVIDQAAGEQFVQDRGFSGAEGGTLNGTLDIPAFAGCTTTDGDDLSAVLTSLVSGPDNPVTVKLGILGCYYAFDEQTYAPLPPQPDTPIADAGCAPDLRDGVQGVPSPLPLPSTAP